MIFSKPIWNSVNKSWNIHISDTNNCNYSEIRGNSNNEEILSDPDITTSTFKTCLEKITAEIILHSKVWFASPIKDTVFFKRVHHNFEKISNEKISNEKPYGSNSLITWTLNKLIIYSNSYELYWSTEIEDYNELSKKEDSIEILRTNIVESAIEHIEIEELNELPGASVEISSQMPRAVYKKKVREARLKAALATMKAEKMAEKYFRRYGNQINFDCESDLSDQSEESE